MVPPSHVPPARRKGFAARKLPKGRALTRAERLALAPRPPTAAVQRYLRLVEMLSRRVRAAAVRRLGDLLPPAPGLERLKEDALILEHHRPVTVALGFIGANLKCGIPLPDWARDPADSGLRQDARRSPELDGLQSDIDALMLEFEPELIKVANEVVRGSGPGVAKFQGGTNEFVRRNVRLVKSLHAGQVDRLEAIVTGATAIGERVEPLAVQLEKEFNLTKARAALIARDQTLKLNAQIGQERAQAAGIETYIWTTSGDARVRGNPSGLYPNSASNHWRLDGTRQSWAKPPVTNPNTGARNHPGEDFQCRCVALPDVDRVLRGDQG